MPEFCKYQNCHNLASILYDGYCNQDHMQRGPEVEFLMKIIYTHKGIRTLKEARQHKAALTLRVGSPEAALTFSFHCEVCKELHHG